MTKQRYRSTSYNLRCPWCGDAGRCAVREDWGACCCRTPDCNEGTPRLDSTGQPYWYHVLDGGKPNVMVRPSVPVADLDMRHRAYTILLDACTLAERHRSNLRQRVGATTETETAELAKIDKWLARNRYRTAPMRERREIAERIVAELGEAVAVTVPGVYKKGEEWSLACAPGILIPVRTAEGLITALKVRRDEAAEDGSRYFYLSSAKHQGPSPQLACHVPVGANDVREVRITEGELKADIATVLSGVLTLSIPGVASWHHARPAIAELSKNTQVSLKCVTLAFDADAARKVQVARPLKCLLEEIMEGAGRYEVVVERWEERQADGRETKGIDDLFAAGLDPERLTGAEGAAWVEAVLETAGASDNAGALMDVLHAVHATKDAKLLEHAELIDLLVDLPAVESMRVNRELKEALGRKHSPKDLNRAIAERRAQRTTAARAVALKTHGLPVVETYNRAVRLIADDGLDAMRGRNKPPRLFAYGPHLARIQTDREGRLVVETLDDLSLCAELEAVALWTRGTERGALIVPVPREAVRDLLGRQDAWTSFPRLTGAVSTPVYTRDGKLITEVGYHPGSGLVYTPSDDMHLSPVGPSPDLEAIAWARRMILQEVLGEFPFADAASRAHAVALMLLPFVRELIDGPTPLHAIDAPTPGTGKGLLYDACTMPFVPQSVPGMTAACREEEWEKKLLTKLRQGPSHILIDNVDKVLSSASLAAALTLNTFDGRILGRSESAACPVRCAWAATGNNLLASPEIARRIVRIRLDARMERPGTREFRHEDLRHYVTEQRMPIIQAILTLVQAWIAADCPPGPARLASYNAWAEVMGGILDVAGIEGFLGNAGDYELEAAPERDEWRAFVSDWWALYEERPVPTRELLALVETLSHLAGGLSDDKGKSFGLAVRKQTDCVYYGKQILRVGLRRGVAYYRLSVVDPQAHAKDLAERALDNPN